MGKKKEKNEEEKKIVNFAIFVLILETQFFISLKHLIPCPSLNGLICHLTFALGELVSERCSKDKERTRGSRRRRIMTMDLGAEKIRYSVQKIPLCNSLEGWNGKRMNGIRQWIEQRILFCRVCDDEKVGEERKELRTIKKIIQLGWDVIISLEDAKDL